MPSELNSAIAPIIAPDRRLTASHNQGLCTVGRRIISCAAPAAPSTKEYWTKTLNDPPRCNVSTRTVARVIATPITRAVESHHRRAATYFRIVMICALATLSPSRRAAGKIDHFSIQSGRTRKSINDHAIPATQPIVLTPICDNNSRVRSCGATRNGIPAAGVGMIGCGAPPATGTGFCGAGAGGAGAGCDEGGAGTGKWPDTHAGSPPWPVPGPGIGLDGDGVGE